MLKFSLLRRQLAPALLMLAAMLTVIPVDSRADSAANTARIATLRVALAEVERASASELNALRRRHGSDPLWPWIEISYLRRHPASLRGSAATDFVDRHAGQPVAQALRRLALPVLAKREDWAGFRQLDDGIVSAADPDLRCHALTARFALGTDATAIDDALALWDSGESLPVTCDPVLGALRGFGRLDTARVLLRIERAAERGNAGLMRFLARRLDAGLRTQVEAEALFIERPSAVASSWPSTPRTRAAVEAGLERLAQADPAAAEALLESLQTPLKLELERSGRLRNTIALWSAASYLPEAADRFARVPASAFDARLHEWQVRERLAQRDASGALAALASMPGSQRDTARWRLIESRLRHQQGDAERAQALLVQAAVEANFHGFLAADLLDRDYHLCVLEPPTERATRHRVATNAGLVRALDLYQLGRPGWAAQEWTAALRDAPLPEQALAVEAALARGWNDRAAQTLGSGDGMRYYGQRFPLPHAGALRSQARRHRLHPAWVAGLIRAESSWMSGARSPADARGLMQLLPTTAQQTARGLGNSFSGAQSLHNPILNIELGTAYLREMLDAHDGQPGLATAAYNAGPAAVARWRQARPQTAPLLDDTILWLETVPFHETREYVARVMAFSLIYDWRLDGRAGSLLARLEGRTERGSRGFTCTPAAAAGP